MQPWAECVTRRPRSGLVLSGVSSRVATRAGTARCELLRECPCVKLASTAQAGMWERGLSGWCEVWRGLTYTPQRCSGAGRSFECLP